MNWGVGWRLGGQSGFVILNKIIGRMKVSVVVLTDDDGSLRSHNVGKFPVGEQIVLLALVKPQVSRVSGQRPAIGIERSRTLVTVEAKTLINSLQVLIVGDRLRGGQGWLWRSCCGLS